MRNADPWCNAIEILRNSARDPRAMNRRSVLTRSALGLGALGLAGLLQNDGRAVAAESASGGSLMTRSPHFPPRAKRVIHFF